MSKSKKVDELLKSYGFELHRRSNHRIYKNKDGVIITTSHTSSDKYALAQIRRTIIKVLAKEANK